MKHHKSDLILFMLFIAMSLGTLCIQGCATGSQGLMVKSGDSIRVNYSCRLPDGKVTMTTYEEIGKNKAALAEIFLPFKEYGPEEITAGKTESTKGVFEREVAVHIAQAAVGMKAGEKNTITLKAEPLADMPDSERYIQLDRIRHRKKERTVLLEDLKNHLGHEPAAGEQAFTFEGVKGLVKAINGNNVVVKLAVKDGATIDTPFGQGTIRDKGETYDIEIDARVGHLVRSGQIIGKIIAVNPDKFTLDYGQPFGGEELMCDVVVESIGLEEQPKKGN